MFGKKENNIMSTLSNVSNTNTTGSFKLKVFVTGITEPVIIGTFTSYVEADAFARKNISKQKQLSHLPQADRKQYSGTIQAENGMVIYAMSVNAYIIEEEL
ncbi:binding-protein-dependent transport systems inner membrane component [Enterococcus phage IME-EFm5]|uniref:Binding-protein-dependent transport systems inner membrane component n=1 Tax=Enterococcus phage IME-EFm5 TaxID=1718158 RepID=A0A0M5M746_9CAUD|nr:binding-protein-dependent transport systems inner membrane component [Enterococcus phage IME-EFm5]ALF01994.1 binding-protein-dependent transport systems inner membrane component [Enterococcus phage IME-EFm5]